MKKKIITIAAIGGMVLLTAAYTLFSTEKNQVNSLMLENIEALAQSESISGEIDCNGNGSIYCPLSNQAVYKEVIIRQKPTS